MIPTTRNTQASNRAERLKRAGKLCESGGKICRPENATSLLEAVIERGDRVVIEGDNQKQADLLAHALAQVDPARIHDLHMIQSVVGLARSPVGLRAGHRRTGLRVRRPPEPQIGLAGSCRTHPDRRNSHLSRTVRADAGRSPAAHRPGCRRQGGPERHCLAHFGKTLTPSEKIYADYARDTMVRDGEIEFDTPTIVSESDDGGAYVMAWVWVDDKDIWNGETDSDGEPCRFINHYRHQACDECELDADGEEIIPEWTMRWSATCNDECPHCGAEIEPYKCIELDLTGKPMDNNNC